MITPESKGARLKRNQKPTHSKLSTAVEEHRSEGWIRLGEQQIGAVLSVLKRSVSHSVVTFAPLASRASPSGRSGSVTFVPHSPSILSTKRQRSILMFANQAIRGTSANIGLW
jgi:hypothetical protein